MTNTTYGEDSFKGTDLSVVGRILSGRKIGDLHSLSVVKLTPIPRTEMSSCLCDFKRLHQHPLHRFVLYH